MKKLPTTFKVKLDSEKIGIEFVETLQVHRLEIENRYLFSLSLIVMHPKLMWTLEEYYYKSDKPYYMQRVIDEQRTIPRRSVMGVSIITSQDIGEDEIKLIIE